MKEEMQQNKNKAKKIALLPGPVSYDNSCVANFVCISLEEIETTTNINKHHCGMFALFDLPACLICLLDLICFV